MAEGTPGAVDTPRTQCEEDSCRKEVRRQEERADPAGFSSSPATPSNAAGWITELRIFWGNYFMDSAVYDT